MINALVRLIYQVAHFVLRVFWFLRRPETTGALVAVWYGGKLLLVRNSYRRTITLPGGYVRRNEERRMAAARELKEEVGVTVLPHRLTHAYHGTHTFEFRKDTLDIFEVELDSQPAIEIDRREVIWAEFKSPQDVLAMNIVPHLDEYLTRRAAKGST